MSASQSVSQSHDQSVIQSASQRVSQSLTAFSKYMYGSIWEVMVHFFERVILFFFFDRTMYMKKIPCWECSCKILILHLSYNEDGIYVCQPSLSQML